MLAPALFLAAREGFTLDEVFGWIQQGAEDFITQRLDTVGDQRAIRGWTAHRSMHEKTKSSIVATAHTLLEGWSSEVMLKVTNTRDGDGDLLDIERLLDENGTLYLIASNADQHIYRPCSSRQRAQPTDVGVEVEVAGKPVALGSALASRSALTPASWRAFSTGKIAGQPSPPLTAWSPDQLLSSQHDEVWKARQKLAGGACCDAAN